MIGALISLIIYLVILAVIWWLGNYALDTFPLPEPANRILRFALVVIIVLAALYVLAGVLGLEGLNVPRMRGL